MSTVSIARRPLLSLSAIVVVGVIAALPACSIASMFSTTLQCEDEFSCPPDNLCRAGLCVPEDEIVVDGSEGEGEEPGEGEGEGETGEGEGEPGEGEGEGEGEDETSEPSLPALPALPDTVFLRRTATEVVLVTQPVDGSLRLSGCDASDGDGFVDVRVTNRDDDTASVSFTGQRVTSGTCTFTQVSGASELGVTVRVVVRLENWFVPEAERRVLFRRTQPPASQAVPTRVDVNDNFTAFFMRFTDDTGARLPARRAGTTRTWWVLLPPNERVMHAYAVGVATDRSDLGPSPWSDHLAVFHLNGDIDDATTGQLRSGANDDGAVYIGVDSDNQSCRANGCLVLSPGRRPVVLADGLELGDSFTVLTSFARDQQPAISQLVGIAAAGNVVVDGSMRTRLGLITRDDGVSAVALPGDAGAVETADQTAIGGTRLDVAAVVDPQQLLIVSVDEFDNQRETTHVLTAPLARTRSGRVVLGGDENLVDERANGSIDEVRIRRGAVSADVAAAELRAMREDAVTGVDEPGG